MSVRAFAPGSITGIFVPAGDDDRSRGASFAIDDGVTVEVTRADTTRVTVDGAPAPFEPVERAVDALGLTAHVDVRPTIPIGRGFGASGAATLATTLAGARLTDRSYSRDELVEIAHQAEMAAETGQGDVFIQNRGGLLVGKQAGITRVETEEPVEYVSYGDIDTNAMLNDEAVLSAARSHGTEQLAALESEPTLRELTERSWSYVTAAGFPTETIETTVGQVSSAGGVASMPLFGEAVFAVGVTDCLANRTHVRTTGANVLEE